MIRRGLLLLALGLFAGCGRTSLQEARTLVSTYNEVVSEAYRRCDIQLIDRVVAQEGPAGRRLMGLIGVRADMGLILDAHLDELEVASAEKREGVLEVRTREHWSYRDRRMDTGEQVGESSVDRYEMIYLFRREGSAWKVSETRFAAQPQVGRKAVPWSLDARDAHAITSPTPAPGVHR
ncbi:MAG TPA: hypothetical protein VJ570_04955 [Holophagaceae bacterium]|nr:hypothetical protein [Holophagaceae bacterium]